MLITYIIVAISFAIMFHAKYTHETLLTLHSLEETHDIGSPIKHFSPIGYSIGWFIISILLMPIVLIMIIIVNRRDLTKQFASHILKKYYDY